MQTKHSKAYWDTVIRPRRGWFDIDFKGLVQYRDLMQVFPYNDEIYRVDVTGEQLRRMVKHILREEAFCGHTEFYQFSCGLYIEYDRSAKELITLTYNGHPVQDTDRFTLALQAFHLRNCKEFLDVTEAELSARRKPKVLSTSCTDILEEHFSGQERVRVSEEPRLVLR